VPAAVLTPTRTLVATATAVPTLKPAVTLAPTRSLSPTLPVPLVLPTRQSAARWKDWPVVPALTNRARLIYQQGVGQNNPRAFSKVGDCQGIKEVWLGVYDQPGFYKLNPENAGLQETIDWFTGSFNRDGYAVMGGFNARAVLQPVVADPEFCQPGESPIECEYRRHHPSIVLVSLEFYYDGRTAENYEKYLRQVLEYYIARGVVPILATKADNMEGDDSLNLVNARLALEFDLPLWNFWKAVQPLPNHGMDITRPDGFHISVDAWRERSASSLQVLDAVWRGLRDLQPAEVRTQATPAVVASMAVGAPATQLIFGLAERGAAGARSRGVYLLDVKAQTITRLLADSYALQAVSPDGTRMLVNQGRDLYLTDRGGGNPKKITADFYALAQSGAAWAPDGLSLVLIVDRPSASDPALGGRAIWQVTSDGAAWQRLTPPQAEPQELAASPNPSEIFWSSGNCPRDAQDRPIASECATRSWYRSGTDGAAPLNLTQMTSILRSPDRQSLAYTYLNQKDLPMLAVSTGEGQRIWTPLPDGFVIDTTWSPSGRWLAALWQERSDYSGKLSAQKMFLLSPSDARRDEVSLPLFYNGQVRWSPDGRWIFVAGTDATADGYRLNMRLIPANGGAATLIDGKISPSGANYLYLTHIDWLPGN